MSNKQVMRLTSWDFALGTAALRTVARQSWSCKVICSVLLSFVIGMARTACADGIVLQVIGTTTLARVGPQRAVIWQRSDALELIIEPVFDWDAEDPGAWVIPFRALPHEIKAGNPVFVNDLDLATAPRFEEACIEPCCCYPYVPCDASAPETKVIGKKDGVMVWSSGSVGALDYVVLSSAEGSQLVRWLEDNGFSLPDPIASVVAEFETAGVYWFVAKVSKEAGRSLMPVSFTFAPVVMPFYPVGLTLNALEHDQPLEVHLFTLTETGEPLVPTSHQWTNASKATGYWPGPCSYNWYWEPWFWGFSPDMYAAKITQ